MAKWILLKQDQYTRMPWKNGLGETLEIQHAKDEHGLRFRISQAAVVEDGPFSNFEGLHRTLVLLSGQGMTLKHNNFEQTLTKPLDIACFSGGEATFASLIEGPIEDLNIMVREVDTSAYAKTLHAPCQLSITAHDDLFTGIYICEDSVLNLSDNTHITIKANSMIVVSDALTGMLTQGSGIAINIMTRN
ncbi:hypothetical protein DN730_01360 [Marinomonas piezotolerans]|uniref:HutD family protein n=1 Tax=Marinomonas piezotolerans TaxID=2213058 RepID=A0A370UD59_9GAMM|nr:HutD family protein [Marinomonas piezotolerans]RDL45723.1 hypothetical protein DN730_01360 [Marinomonas piezotolerans]